MERRGLFVTLEGADGCGKSTQLGLLREFIIERSNMYNFKYIFTREPGGTEMSEIIRRIILDKEYIDIMDDLTEAYLFAASRANHVQKLIIPSLVDDKLVFSDRYVDSSIAYQGAGRGLGMDRIKEINNHAIQGSLPDITYFIYLDPDIAMARKRKQTKLDRIESAADKDFQHRVVEGFLTLASKEPNRFMVIDGSKSMLEVHNQIANNLEKVLVKKYGNSK